MQRQQLEVGDRLKENNQDNNAMKILQQVLKDLKEGKEIM